AVHLAQALVVAPGQGKRQWQRGRLAHRAIVLPVLPYHPRSVSAEPVPEPLRVAVRRLCDFAARTGDLDHRFTPAPSAFEGIVGHASVAARRPAHYQRERTLSGLCEGLLLQGRADGYDPQA